MKSGRSHSSRRRPRADAQRNRERLLEAARDAFTRFGPGASLDDIVRRARVGPGTLYRHFPTREALREAVYRSEVEKLAAFPRNDENLTPIEALRAWLRMFVDAIARKKIILPALNGRVIEESYAPIHDAVRTLARRAVDSGDLRKDLDPVDFLRALIGVSQAATQAGWQSRARAFVDILLAGSRPAKKL